MAKIQKETRVAAPRCFAFLEYVFLVLALSLSSLAANAASQGLKGNAGRTACRIASINTATGVVTARVLVEEGGVAGSKDSGSGQSFRFLVKDAALLRSLKDGLEIFADFSTQQVFTSAGVRLGSILTDNSGKSSAGPAAGASQPDKIPQPTKAAQPARPSVGMNPQPNQPLQPTNKTAGPVGAGAGTSPQPGKIGEPAGPAGGRNPLADTGANLGRAAKPAQSVSQITSINAARGVVGARVNSSGESFRFFVRDSALLSSLKEGESIVADFNSQEVFTSAGASGPGVRLGSILTDPYGKSLGGPSGGTNPPGAIGDARPSARGLPAPGGQPETQSAPVAPAGLKAGMNQAATNAPSSSAPGRLTPAGITLQTNPLCSTNPSHLTQPVASGVIVPSGATIYCRFTVPSDVAQQAGASLAISISDSSVASSPTTAALSTASGGSGNPYADFQISTQPISETFPLTISASCGQFSGSTMVTLARAAIKRFATEYFGGTPSGGYLGDGMSAVLYLWLTAPADPDGFHVPVTADDGSFTGEIYALGGSQLGNVYGGVPHQAVLTDTPVTYSVKDPLDGSVQTVKIVVKPPYVSGISPVVGGSINNVPLDGIPVTLSIYIMGDGPAGGMTFNVNYSAVDAKNNALPSEVTGPPSVTLPAGTGYPSGTRLPIIVTFYPCGVNPPCKATVTAGAATAIINVNP